MAPFDTISCSCGEKDLCLWRVRGQHLVMVYDCEIMCGTSMTTDYSNHVLSYVPKGFRIPSPYTKRCKNFNLTIDASPDSLDLTYTTRDKPSKTEKKNLIDNRPSSQTTKPASVFPSNIPPLDNNRSAAKKYAFFTNKTRWQTRCAV
jgi:hypothetical protein